MSSVDSWKSLDSEELELQYSPSRWSLKHDPEKAIREYEQIIKQETDRYRLSGTGEWDIPYGPKPSQRIDFYRRDDMSKDCPVLIFFHGGYWYLGSRLQSGFWAGALNDAGIVLAAVDYSLAPDASVVDIVEEATLAVSFILSRAEADGSSAVIVSGHSAGGQLAVMSTIRCSPHPLLKGCIPMSGVFDLRPIRFTPDNAVLKLTDESAWEMSPLREQLLRQLKQRCVDVTFLVVCGDCDSPEFQRQSQLYQKNLSEKQVDCSMLLVSNRDHFTLLTDSCASSTDTLIQEILQFVRNCKRQ